MSRKKKAPAAENHERWLISYADFITLLFAFFVVMFASSQTDKGKAQAMSEAIAEGFKHDKMAAVVKEILGGAPGSKEKGNAQNKGPGGDKKLTAEEAAAAAKIVELVPSMRLLQSELKHEIATGMLKVTMEARGVVISLRQAAFFPSGQDTIDAVTYPAIEKIARVLLTVPNRLRLEGHTDAVPIRTAKYRSNWELSAARGVTMLELLVKAYQVPEARLAVGGYAETIPIASNETPEGRAQNRRVDVVILNETGSKGEPEKMKETPPLTPPVKSPAARH